jgi:PDZ domain-containing secreted protein
LNIGDTVVSINGQTFESSQGLIKYVSGLELDSDVTVGYLVMEKKRLPTEKLSNYQMVKTELVSR